MTTPAEHEQYQINCRACGRVETKTLGWIGWNKTYMCTCGATVDAAEQLALIEIERIKKVTADMQDKLAELRRGK